MPYYEHIMKNYPPCSRDDNENGKSIALVNYFSKQQLCAKGNNVYFLFITFQTESLTQNHLFTYLFHCCFRHAQEYFTRDGSQYINGGGNHSTEC